MKQKLVFSAIFLVNVQLLFGFRYPQYEDHAAKGQSAHQEITPTHSITDYKSHPPFGSLNKKKGDQQFGQWLERRFNSFGSDAGLRKFQKATNSLRRNNIEGTEIHEGKNVCGMPRKNQKEREKHMRRTETEAESHSDMDDIDLNALDKKIQQLIRVRTLQKFKQALDSVLTDDYGSIMEDDNNTGHAKRRINDDSSDSSEESSDDEDDDEEDDSIKDNEGSGNDDNNKIK